MTTAVEARRFVRILLEKHPELIWTDRCVIDSPVRHYIRYFLIDRGMDPEIFKPQWNVKPMYRERRRLGGTMFVRHLRHPTAAFKQWYRDDPEAPLVFAAAARRPLRVMRAVDTPQDFIEFERLDKPPYLHSHDEMEIPHRLVAGQLDRARELLVKVRPAAFGFWKTELERFGVWDALLRHGSAISAAERKKIADFFHTVERKSVESLKLRSIWEPTPFPLELDIC